MNEKRVGRLTVVLLILFAAAVFGLGINWGLPSKSNDSFFFQPQLDENLDSTLAFRNSGAGIDHLAGDWQADPNRPADVAAHVITNRSQPVTLIENKPAITREQIVAAGDRKLVSLIAKRDVLWKQWKVLGAQANAKDSQFADVQDQYSTSENAINEEVAAYNAKHNPGYVDSRNRDAKYQAEILRRYHLYTYQPDEMITFRALAYIHPSTHQFDPKLYQYGGLWIYPIGALSYGGWIVGLLNLSNSRGFYLDHPDEFNKFYLLARGYSAIWGIIGMLAVYRIVRKSTPGRWPAALAAILFVIMPVVLDQAHEAKPHLAGISLVLLSILASIRYLETNKVRYIVYASLAVGAAISMVLSAAAGIFVIPTALLIGPGPNSRRAKLLSIGVAVVVVLYCITNPFVIVHLVHHDPVLWANLGNSNAMYAFAPDPVNAVRLIAAGTSPLLLVLAIAAGLMLFRRRPIHPLAWLLGVPAIVAIIQFMFFAGHKPGEYARFAMFADVAIMLLAVLATQVVFANTSARTATGFVLILVTAVYAFGYENGFLADTRKQTTRVEAAALLEHMRADMKGAEIPTLGVYAEPAPYNVPPFDLLRWKLVLLPPGSTDANVILERAPESSVWNPCSTPISWANISFEITPHTH